MEIKIGMVAPSKAGKTSLLATTFSEMQLRLSGNQLGIQYWASDKRTQDAICRVMAEYRAITASDDVFATPQMSGNVETSDYRFSYTIPVKAGAPQRLNVWFKDFPGGLVGMADFEEEVGPFVRDSTALLVPIPADILMEWKDTDKVNDPMSIRRNIAASCMLRVTDTVAIVKNWVAARTQAKEASLLIFVPVRCEAYFNDNGGTSDKSARLFAAVQELYVDALGLTADNRQYVQIETHAVDTYGTVELQSVDLVETPNGDMLESKFRKRLSAGNSIRSKGAFDILAAISSFELKKSAKALKMELSELEHKLANQSFFKMLFSMIFGSEEQRLQVQKMQANEATYQAIAVISQLARPDEYRQKVINQIMD